MRFLGIIFILLALGAVGLDFLASQENGAFALRSLDELLSEDIGLDLFSLYENNIAATLLELPGAILLGAVGVALYLISAVLFGARRT